MSSKYTIAYLAGVIDSDGTIGIKKSTYSMRVRHEGSQPVYAERVSVKQVEPHAVNLLKQTFGGSLYMQGPSTAKGRSLYSWTIHSKSAGTALRRLLPYLQIKHEQAANALKLRELIDQGKEHRRWPVPKIDPKEQLVSALDFARIVGSNPKSIWQACRNRSIPSVTVGRRRWIPLSFAPSYHRERRGPPRDAAVGDAMESLYLKSKHLNRVGSR